MEGEFFLRKRKTEEEKQADLEAAFEKLKQIAEILGSMGFRMRDHLIKKEFLSETTTPLVADGCDGIRFSYDKYDGQLTISFTNGFEDFDNPKRLEVVKKLNEAGFGSNVIGGDDKR